MPSVPGSPRDRVEADELRSLTETTSDRRFGWVYFLQ
jgi:hypothetical protein